MLFQLACNAATLKGHFAECGVYRGGSAALFALIKAASTNLYLFDTFEGMPQTDHARDYHRAKDFCDTSYEGVQKVLKRYSNIEFRKGFFPQTTKGLEATVFSLVHVDFDIYQSVLDACNFFYPRLVRGGYIIFDDYGWPSCPGAKQAVQEFGAANEAREIYLPTGQALLCNFQSSISWSNKVASSNT
jgi:O-methyltransferase